MFNQPTALLRVEKQLTFVFGSCEDDVEGFVDDDDVMLFLVDVETLLSLEFRRNGFFFKRKMIFEKCTSPTYEYSLPLYSSLERALSRTRTMHR